MGGGKKGTSLGHVTPLPVHKKSPPSNPPPTSKINSIFDKQDKDYNFRNEELLKYRDEAKKLYEKNDLDKRFNKIEEKSFQISRITKDKREQRLLYKNVDYGNDKYLFAIERNEKGKSEFVARNYKTNKIVAKIEDNKKKSSKQLKQELFDKIKKEEFKYEKLYVKEDTEPLKEIDDRKNWTLSYNTYYRYGIIIYRMKDNKHYEIIFQSADSQARSIYVAYQRIIAEIKSEILRETNITLEEWIYLSKTTNNIKVEGGISYKRYKGLKEKDMAYKAKLDYEYMVNFEEI